MDIPLLSIRQLTDIWATRNLLCCEHSCVSFHVDKVFIFLGWIPRMGLLGYYGRTVFQSSCVLFFHVFIDHLYTHMYLMPPSPPTISMEKDIFSFLKAFSTHDTFDTKCVEFPPNNNQFSNSPDIKCC